MSEGPRKSFYGGISESNGFLKMMSRRDFSNGKGREKECFRQEGMASDCRQMAKGILKFLKGEQ